MNRNGRGMKSDSGSRPSGRNNPKLPAAAMPEIKRQSGSSSGGVLNGEVKSFSLFELFLERFDDSLKFGRFERGLAL